MTSRPSSPVDLQAAGAQRAAEHDVADGLGDVHRPAGADPRGAVAQEVDAAVGVELEHREEGACR